MSKKSIAIVLSFVMAIGLFTIISASELPLECEFDCTHEKYGTNMFSWSDAFETSINGTFEFCDESQMFYASKNDYHLFTWEEALLSANLMSMEELKLLEYALMEEGRVNEFITERSCRRPCFSIGTTFQMWCVVGAGWQGVARCEGHNTALMHYCTATRTVLTSIHGQNSDSCGRVFIIHNP